MTGAVTSMKPLLVARGVNKRFGACSLVTHPRVLILDEPTAALGAVQTAQVLTLIGALPGRAVAA